MGIMLHLIASHPGGTQPGRVLGRNYPFLSWGEICIVLENLFITQLCLCMNLAVVSVGDVNSPPFTLLAAFRVRVWLLHTATEGRMLQKGKVDCSTGLLLTVPAPMNAVNMSGDCAGMKHGTVSSIQSPSPSPGVG